MMDSHFYDYNSLTNMTDNEIRRWIRSVTSWAFCCKLASPHYRKVRFEAGLWNWSKLLNITGTCPNNQFGKYDSEPIDIQRNPFLEEVLANFSRILSMVDLETANETYGSCDGDIKAWCYTDYQNGTYRGLCHGIARLVASYGHIKQMRLNL